jgi:hypothetical protein
MSKLILYTKDPRFSFSKENIKKMARVVFQRKRGPSSVSSSIIRGFATLKTNYILNPPFSVITKEDIVIVNESLQALKECVAIDCSQLIAGPNLVIHPYDCNKILLNPSISTILEPSLWTANFIATEAPEIKQKIVIWPAGVEIPPMNPKAEKLIDILVYLKNPCDVLTTETILSILANNKLTYKVLYYGSFNQSDYFKLLEKSKALLYVSHSESQGIALLEAWARDVPTLVYNRGYYFYNNRRHDDENISGPYVTSECGMFFNDTNLDQSLQEFMSNLSRFSARNYAQINFSDTTTTTALLSIIYQNKK